MSVNLPRPEQLTGVRKAAILLVSLGEDVSAELLRQLIKNSIAEHIGSSGESVTVSLGVAISPDHGKNGEDLLRAADEALYRAKALGRDRVIVAGHERTAFRSIPLLTSVAKHKY